MRIGESIIQVLQACSLFLYIARNKKGRDIILKPKVIHIFNFSYFATQVS